MSLQNVLAEIKKVKPFADEELTQEPIETLNARRGRKNQSVERMKQLKREYKSELMQNTVFIIATGSGREEFVKTATEDFGLFSADPEAFYKDLAGRVPEVLYKGKEGVSNIFDVLGRHLEDKMMELDINAYNQLLFKQGYAKTLKSVEEFTQLVKQAVNDQIGAEIAGIQAIDSLVETAIEKNHADKITPVVLSTGDENFALALLKDLARLDARVFLTVSGDSSKELKSAQGAIGMKDASKKSVQDVLKQVKQSLKK